MKFTENWYSPKRLAALTRLARSTNGVSGTVVEVGAWEGRSTCALLRAVAPDIVHAIDTWEGSHTDISADLALRRPVYEIFIANATEAGGNFEVLRMDWRDAFATWDAPIRFLHIDGEHTYAQVYDNIQAALPVMAPGGIICGDDFACPEVRRAVEASFGEDGFAVEHDTLWWKRI